MAVRIQDPSNVFITDPATGKEHNAGQIMDVIRNWPNEASNVQVALAEWWTFQKTKHRDDIDLAKDELREELQTQFGKDYDVVIKERDEKIALLEEKQLLVDALGGTELGQAHYKQKQLERISKERIRLQEEEDALNAKAASTETKVKNVP